jgi:hypothetical protein
MRKTNKHFIEAIKVHQEQERRKVRNKKISGNQLVLRKKLWPDVKETDLWDKKKHDGWTTIPRTMPLILDIVDSLSPRGCPASGVYFDLWCRVFDENFVTLGKPLEMAFTSGFHGQRREQAWTQRIDLLDKLGFIRLAGGLSGKRSYALILNPHKVINALRRKSVANVSKDLYDALAARAVEVKANDFTED